MGNKRKSLKYFILLKLFQSDRLVIYDYEKDQYFIVCNNAANCVLLYAECDGQEDNIFRPLLQR